MPQDLTDRIPMFAEYKPYQSHKQHVSLVVKSHVLCIPTINNKYVLCLRKDLILFPFSI